MADRTWKERLSLVRSAIDEILLHGQDVSYDGRRVGMADLDGLRRLEADYEARANAEAASCGPARSRISYVVPE
jgi:hypothetical protein